MTSNIEIVYFAKFIVIAKLFCTMLPVARLFLYEFYAETLESSSLATQNGGIVR